MDQPPPKEPRAPINLRIKFRSESTDQFIDRYAIDVSRGGIFIRTREPLAVGTQLKFDFQLQDSSPLMAGEGTVVWIREYDASRTGVTPGMGVRFDKLSPASQSVLEKILSEKGHRDQNNAGGGVMSKVGAGMAVRRPSSTFTALDPRAQGMVTSAAGPGGETPPVGTANPDAATRRERRPSPTTSPMPPSSSTGPFANAERTNPSPYALGSGPGVGPQRPRTPSGLPALESQGGGRRGSGGDGPSSLVSRLSAPHSTTFETPTPADIDRALDGLTGGEDGRTGHEPTPVRRSPLSATGGGVPGLREDDASNEPTKTGDALSDLSDVFSGATRLDAADRSAAVAAADAAIAAAKAAAGGTVDSAAPVAEVDSDRTLATSAEQVAQIVAASERVAEAMESAAKSSPASAVRRDERIASEQTPPPAVMASAALSPTAAGSFTSGMPGPTGGADVGSAVPPFDTAKAPPAAGDTATPLTAAKSGSARPPKRKSVVPFAIAGLAAAGALIALVVSQRSSTPDHSAESFQTRKPDELVAPKESAAPAVAGAAAVGQANPAAPAAAPIDEQHPAAAPAAGETNANANKAAEPSKAAEAPAAAVATPPAPGSETAPAGAPAAGAEAEPAKTASVPPRADKANDAKAKAPGGERKTVVLGPKKIAPAASPASASASALADDKRPVMQHLLRITSIPAGAEVLIDGQTVGTTPYQAKDIDADSPHAVTIRLDGYEPHEHMISGSDWLKQKANLDTVKVNVKLRKLSAAAEGEPAPAAKTESVGTEPAKTEPTKAEPPAKAEGATRGETKTEPPPVTAPPAEKATDKPEKATEPPPASAVEPPKNKDEPAAVPK